MYFIKDACVLEWASQVTLVVKNAPNNASRRKRWGFSPWVRKVPWRRAQQPAPVFMPGEFHGKKSLTNRCNNTVFLFKVLASLFLNPLKLAQVSRNYHIINDEEILHNWKQMLSFFGNWWGVGRKKKTLVWIQRSVQWSYSKMIRRVGCGEPISSGYFFMKIPSINEDSVSSNMSIENQHSWWDCLVSMTVLDQLQNIIV